MNPAGLPTAYRCLILHDNRRSAVRRMVRNGIPERVAMTTSGHKTRSVFDRYNITSQSDLRDAASKLENGHEIGFGHDFGHDASQTQQSQTKASEICPNLQHLCGCLWCREGESNPHSPFGPADFKSAASANFAIPAWEWIGLLQFRTAGIMLVLYFPASSTEVEEGEATRRVRLLAPSP